LVLGEAVEKSIFEGSENFWLERVLEMGGREEFEDFLEEGIFFFDERKFFWKFIFEPQFFLYLCGNIFVQFC